MKIRAGLEEQYVWRVQVTARQASLNRLLERFDEFARARRLPAALRRDLYLVLDELVSNVVHANHRSKRARIGVELILDRDNVALEVIDNGKAFDPTTVQPPRGAILDRPVGGLGIQLVHGLMDTVVYTRQHGSNHLVLTRVLTKRSRSLPAD